MSVTVEIKLSPRDSSGIRVTVSHRERRVIVWDPVPLADLAEDGWLALLVTAIVGKDAYANGPLASRLGAVMAFCLAGDIDTWLAELPTEDIVK